MKSHFPSNPYFPPAQTQSAATTTPLEISRHLYQQPVRITASQTLRKMHKQVPDELQKIFKTFETGTDSITLENFFAGIRTFTKLANLSFNDRRRDFGNQFLGLHFNNELADKWNEIYFNKAIASELNSLCPPEWNYVCKEKLKAFVYKGKDPARALDSFVKGPTTIDCGKFTQLAIWFGIRNMLGNEKFNQLFSNAPFYITQLNFDGVRDPHKPYLGNPFFQFLSQSTGNPNMVSVSYIQNEHRYRIKHPDGNAGGQNCIEVNGQFIIFNPALDVTHDLSLDDIKFLLANEFNKPGDRPYEGRLDNTDKLLLELAKNFKDSETHVTLIGQNVRRLYFDLDKFQEWVEKMSYDLLQPVPYKFEEKPSPPEELLKTIPFENKGMDFSEFNANIKSSDQEKLFNLAKTFCSDVMNGQPSQVVITGNAGVGKTASAVACAKELASKGIKVLWITEDMITGLTDQSTSMQEYNQYLAKLENSLKSADVVFLDDTNNTGIVLEKCYDWFAKQEEGKGKGLYITSNNTDLSLVGSFGIRLDGSYACAPLCDYMSPEYMHTRTLNLDGASLRQLRSNVNLPSETEVEKIQRLVASKNPMSIGIIVDSEHFDAQQKDLKEMVCLVPGFEDLASIRRSFMKSGVPDESYNNLSQEQKNWLVQINDGKGIKVTPFSETPKPIIAVELLEEKQYYDETIKIEYDCFAQLLKVIKSAHDNGEKKVIIINKTSFSNEGLLRQIIRQMPKEEEKRSIERLRLLLGIDIKNYQVEEVD